MKKILILLLVQILIINLFSQNIKIDSTKILYTAKFQVLESEAILFSNIKKLEDYIESKFTSRFLKSKGFDDTKFILIEKRSKSLDSTFIKNKKEAFKKNYIYFSCDYIVAYVPSTGFFYKLKGFRKNDFPELMDYLDKNSYLYSNSLKNYIFLGLAYVEDLDLECLNEYYIRKKKNKKIKKDYPCLRSCAERDRNIYVH